MTESVPLNTPLADMDMDADVAHYVGLLEGTVAMQVIQMNKFRALLELLTGDQWDDVKLDPNGERLKEISINALVKQTGMSKVQATILVQKRWDTYNQPEDNRSLENDSSTPTPPSMSERYRSWRAKQLAEVQTQGEETSRDGTGFVPVAPVSVQVPQSISVDARE